MLNSLSDENKLKVPVPPSVVDLLFNGIFLWINSLAPEGLADSLLTTDPIIQINLLHEDLVPIY